jgi:uncharacterized integral membrane protein
MDFLENDDSSQGVVKWPFYVAALFIIILVLCFAITQFKVDGVLETWPLITCILASAIASILVFIPNLIDQFLNIALDPEKFKNQELERKTYFDIKEMRTELDAVSVKIDKVPTLVDKIVTEAGKSSESDQAISQLSTQLETSYSSLLEKIHLLEELIVQPPLLSENTSSNSDSDQEIKSLKNAVHSLSNKIDDLKKRINDQHLAKSTTEVLEEDTNNIEREQPTELSVEDGFEVEPHAIDEMEEEPDPKKLNDLLPDSIDDDVESSSDIQVLESNEENAIDESVQLLEDPLTEEDIFPVSSENNLESEENDDEANNSSEAASNLSDTYLNEDQDIDEETEEDIEKDLLTDPPQTTELPDPTETLRKVDAILQETDPEKPVQIKEPINEKKDSVQKNNTGTTSVVANVMIGIGNKPFLRGEGPGLSWDEGVPMNFIEIGKWSWSPPKKNASLTVQLYRNDNDPDKSGKIEVKPGEKIEITPEFN